MIGMFACLTLGLWFVSRAARLKAVKS